MYQAGGRYDIHEAFLNQLALGEASLKDADSLLLSGSVLADEVLVAHIGNLHACAYDRAGFLA